MAAEHSQHTEWTDEQRRQWAAVLAAGAKAQRLVPDAVAVGGTAAALYAEHRLSVNTDHLLSSLRSRFDEVLDMLEHSDEWRTARVQPPVLILGSIGGIQVGFWQAWHAGEIESAVIQTAQGPIRVPTVDETIGMKAYMAYARNAVRDYLDFAALCECADEPAVLASLLKSDARYGHLQSRSVAMEIAKRLADPAPYDLKDVRLDEYKGLASRWRVWPDVAERCRHFGQLLGERLVLKGP